MGGQAPCCLPPLGSVLEQHEVSGVQLRVMAETVECKGLWESCWRLRVCVAYSGGGGVRRDWLICWPSHRDTERNCSHTDGSGTTDTFLYVLGIP